MSNIFERKEFTVFIVGISFALVFVPYFLDIPGLMQVSTKVSMIVSMINAFAIILALYAQTRRSVTLVEQKNRGWQFHAWTVFLLYLVAIVGFVYGQTSPNFLFFQYAFLMPAGAVQYSILTFYMASAGMKAFRARSPQAALLIVAGVLVMLGQAPFTGTIFPPIEGIKGYILDSFAKAAAKMFSMSMVVGAIVLCVRILTGNEEQALGHTGGG